MVRLRHRAGYQRQDDVPTPHTHPKGRKGRHLITTKQKRPDDIIDHWSNLLPSQTESKPVQTKSAPSPHYPKDHVPLPSIFPAGQPACTANTRLSLHTAPSRLLATLFTSRGTNVNTGSENNGGEIVFQHHFRSQINGGGERCLLPLVPGTAGS